MSTPRRTMSIDVTLCDVTRDHLQLDGDNKRVFVKMSASAAEFLADKLNQWVRDRQVDLDRVKNALKGG